MADSEESTSSGFVTSYDFTRYLLIINKASWSPEDVINSICEEAPYRVFSNDLDDLKWDHIIIIKYPNRRFALREGIILNSQGTVRGAFNVELVTHILVFLAKSESECDDTLKESTYVSISKFPDRINLRKWKKLLSKFGRVSVSEKYSKDGELFIIAMYETMAEAVGVIIALHGHTIDGQELVVKLCRREKENRIFSVYREMYKKCSSLLNHFPLSTPPDRDGIVADTSEPQKCAKKSSSDLLLCNFCSLGTYESFVDFYSDEENTDVPWENEFPELKENIVEDGFVLIDDDWELVDDYYSVPSLEENCWEIVNFNDFQEVKD